MKIGQRVVLRTSTDEPKAAGTVTRVRHDGSFRVSYDPRLVLSPTGMVLSKTPGGRFWYPAERAVAFARSR